MSYRRAINMELWHAKWPSEISINLVIFIKIYEHLKYRICDSYFLMLVTTLPCDHHGIVENKSKAALLRSFKNWNQRQQLGYWRLSDFTLCSINSGKISRKIQWKDPSLFLDFNFHLFQASYLALFSLSSLYGQGHRAHIPYSEGC